MWDNYHMREFATCKDEYLIRFGIQRNASAAGSTAQCIAKVEGTVLALIDRIKVAIGWLKGSHAAAVACQCAHFRFHLPSFSRDAAIVFHNGGGSQQ
jgi:hypothetical protein